MKKVRKIQEQLSDLRADYQKVQMYRHAATHLKVVKTFVRLESKLQSEIAELERELFG